MSLLAPAPASVDPAILAARELVRSSKSQTELIRSHFAAGRPNNSHDSTTEGTVKALTLLLAADKKFNPVK